MHDLWPKVVEETKTRTRLSYVHGKGEKQHKPITILNVITNCVLPSFFYKKDTEATICDYRGALEFSSTNGYAQSEGKFMYEDLPLFMK